MKPEVLKAGLGSLVRHALTILGGYLASEGLLDPANENTLVGGGMVAAGVVWSLIQKHRSIKA